MDNYKLLDQMRHILIDMDGVLWRGSTPMPGLGAFFDLLRQEQIRFVLVTNNGSRTVDHYTERLQGYGIAVAPDEILTSALATAGYLAERSEAGASVYAIGEEGLQRALLEAGFHLIDGNTDVRLNGLRASLSRTPHDAAPAYVVVSWDRHLTYEKLAQATLYIRAGAAFIGTNPDKTWPHEHGLLPGAGATLAALQAATDTEPKVIGKPFPELYRLAMQSMGATQYDTVMLGDRLDTDILGAQNAGLGTILVLSGVTKAEHLTASPVQPDLVFEDIAALTRALRERRAAQIDGQE